MPLPQRRADGVLVRRLASGLALAAIACGDGPSEPKPITLAPGVRVVGGMGVSDTIETRPQPLVLELRDEGGQPRVGVAVRFEVPPSSRGSVGVCMTLLLARCANGPERFYYADSGTVVSDAEGMVSMPVQLGLDAGTAWVRVLSPAIGLRDSVRYVVRPGRAERIRISPAEENAFFLDEAVYVGARLRIRAAIVDRASNVISTGVRLTGDEHVSVASNGELVATSVGFARLRATGGGFTAPFGLSVVPRGRFALADSAGLFLSELDGSGQRLVAPSLRGLGKPAWSADGRTLYAEHRFLLSSDSGFRTGIVAIDTTTGAHAHLVESDGRVLQGTSPSPSRDGRWLYLVRDGGASRLELSTGVLERIIIPGITGVRTLDVSPSGERLAFETAMSGQSQVRVFDLVTRQLSGTAAPGFTPRWSPDGARLAFVNLAGVPAVAAADASSVRVIAGDAPDHPFPIAFQLKVDWTADGKFLVGLRPGGLTVLGVDTGDRLAVYVDDWSRHGVALLR